MRCIEFNIYIKIENETKKNPFKFGKIVTSSNFCNRKQEIRELKQYITDGYSVWLYSPRRYGKSSLIYRVFKELSNIKLIYLDLYNVFSTDDFCRKYSKLLASELFDWKDDIKVLTKKMTQRKILSLLAIPDDRAELFSEETRNKFQLPASSSINTILKALMKKDLIHKADKSYKINNPVFKAWLRQISRKLIIRLIVILLSFIPPLSLLNTSNIK